MGISKKPFKVAGKSAYYYKLDGRRLSLGTANLSEACRLLAAVKRAYLDGKVQSLLGNNSTTLGAFEREFLEWSLETQPTSTYKANRLALRKIIEEAGESTLLERLTAKTLDLVKAHHSHLKPASTNCYIRHAKAVMNKAVEWGYLKSNPFRSVKELPRSQAATAYLSGQEVEQLLTRVEDMGMRRLIASYLATGRRRSEMLRLRWEDIQWDRNRYFVAREKRNLCRYYPLSATFKSILESFPPKTRGAIFPGWHPDTVTHYVKRALVAAGFGHLRLHDLRHSFAVLFLDGGGGLKQLQGLLGHSEFRMTSDVYAHVSDDSLLEAANSVRLGPLLLFKK